MNRTAKMQLFQAAGLVVLVIVGGMAITTLGHGLAHVFRNVHSHIAWSPAHKQGVHMQLSANPTPVGGTAGQLQFAQVTALDLSIANGEVTIQPGTGAEASLAWDIKASNGPGAAAADTLQVLSKLTGSKLTVHDEYNGADGLQRPYVNLTLSLPANATVEAALGNGTLRIDNNAQLAASLGNGKLILAGNCPTAEASVGNGTVQTDWLLGSGKYDLSVGNGEINLGLRSGSSFSYEADAGMGGIELGGLPGQVSKAFMSQSADGTVGGGAGKLSLSVGMGHIRLTGGASAKPADTSGPQPQVPGNSI